MPDLFEDILSRLDGVRRQGSEAMARCPSHDDSDPSLSIKRGDSQPVVLHCFAGCPPERVISALRLSWQHVCEDVGELPETSRKAARAQDFLPEKNRASDRLLEIEQAKRNMTPAERDRYTALCSMLRASYSLRDAGEVLPYEICDCGAAWWSDSDPKRPLRKELWDTGSTDAFPLEKRRRLQMQPLVHKGDRHRLKEMIGDLIDRACGRISPPDSTEVSSTAGDGDISDLF